MGFASKLFQFPTGWNSTAAETHWLVFFKGGFNSQRDGILPYTEVLENIKN